jgi:hypothetical protein
VSGIGDHNDHEANRRRIMLKAIKMLAVAAAFVVSASSAFAAVTYHRDNGQWLQSNSSYGISTDRDSMVEQTGN